MFLSPGNFDQNHLFEKFFQEYHQRVSNSLDPDQGPQDVGLIGVQNVCLGYQQVTLVVSVKLNSDFKGIINDI